MTGRDTSHMDEQAILSAIDELLALNGWVAAMCPTLTRPFGQNKFEEEYDALVGGPNLDDHDNPDLYKEPPPRFARGKAKEEIEE